jgi:hypothetical protein
VLKKDILSEKSSFLFIGCDGMFDFSSNDTIAEHFKKEINGKEKIDIKDMCESLIDYTILEKKSLDNCSSIIVLFDKNLIKKIEKPKIRLDLNNLITTKLKDLLDYYKENKLFEKNVESFFEKIIGLNKFNEKYLKNLLKEEGIFEKDFSLTDKNFFYPDPFIRYFNKCLELVKSYNEIKERFFQDGKHPILIDYLVNEEKIITIDDFITCSKQNLVRRGINLDLVKFLNYSFTLNEFNKENDFDYNEESDDNEDMKDEKENFNVWIRRNFENDYDINYIFNKLKGFNKMALYYKKKDDILKIFDNDEKLTDLFINKIKNN